MIKKIKVAIICGLITSTFLTAQVYAANNFYSFNVSTGGTSIQRTDAYEKDDGDNNWYYTVKSYANNDSKNKAAIYLSTTDTANNKTSGDAKITGKTDSTKSKLYSWGAGAKKGASFKLQARADKYGATFSGYFCP